MIPRHELVLRNRVNPCEACEQRVNGTAARTHVCTVQVMRMIAIAWALAGLGCTPAERAYNTCPGHELRAYFVGCRNVDVAAAHQLTRSARNAARRGDCAAVAKLDVQVRALDVDVHDTEFVRDAAIARCLAGTVPSPPSITPAPEPAPEYP